MLGETGLLDTSGQMNENTVYSPVGDKQLTQSYLTGHSWPKHTMPLLFRVKGLDFQWVTQGPLYFRTKTCIETIQISHSHYDGRFMRGVVPCITLTQTHHVGGENEHPLMLPAWPLRVVQEIRVVLPKVSQVIPWWSNCRRRHSISTSSTAYQNKVQQYNKIEAVHATIAAMCMRASIRFYIRTPW